MNVSNAWKFIIMVIGTQFMGAIGAVATRQSIPVWYAELVKAPLTPPNWIFGPAWTVLYLLMGVAAFLVWREWGKGSDHKIKIALFVFDMQLTLNLLWSILFFTAQNPAAALIEICVLWLAILGTIIYFSKVSKTAAWLLVPYILWVSFAVYLNYSIWRLN